MKFSGEFSILEGNNIVSFGRIYASDDTLQKQNLVYDKKSDKDFDLILDSNDVYKELRIRGYDYGPKFRGIQELRIEDSKKVYGSIEWTGNMIPFMDSLIQSQAIALPFRKIFVPVMIASIRCDPKKFFDAVEETIRLFNFIRI
jgi:fatty acid synthase